MCHKSTFDSVVSAGSVVQTETVRLLLFQRRRHLFVRRLKLVKQHLNPSHFVLLGFLFLFGFYSDFFKDFVPSILRNVTAGFFPPSS